MNMKNINTQALNEDEKRLVMSALNRYAEQCPSATEDNLQYFRVDYVKRLLKRKRSKMTEKAKILTDSILTKL